MKLIYTGYKWREATGMELLLRGDEEVLKQIPTEPHAGDVYETGKEERQLSLASEFHAEPNLKTYNGWILTVGDLKRKLAVYSDETQVRLDFRGKTPFGELIDVSMPIECIGNSCTYDNGERKNLIYISGNGK
ncbi:hypothetical protein SDC9_142279 [bioreactor metagenome]|uniref:Uncharacterized protein n=1 Tax=bioreactor metagenome TaxID=1076179 RepID=A0A645E175_9ZZZZ